jgi:hypothetical protein
MNTGPTWSAIDQTLTGRTTGRTIVRSNGCRLGQASGMIGTQYGSPGQRTPEALLP